MKILILGKERQLTNIDPSGLFFLTNPKDMSETGIYSGETLENWSDEAYLKRIRAHPQIFFNDKEKLADTMAEEFDNRKDQRPTTEYRFENTDVGQGHYFTELTHCLNAARHKSKESPTATFLIETFRPKRTRLATLKNNVLTFAPDKPFTVQTAEKTSEDIRRLRKSNYGRQPIPEIVKNLTAIAESKCINQPAPREASLWNAIDILEDLDAKERRLI